MTSTPGNERVELHFDVADTAATFGVDYVATHAAKRWSDTAELYWQFVGDEARIPCDKVRITIALPAGVQRDQVRAWAHGPLWGDVTIRPDASVLLTVAPLPAETFVEARVLFPAAALPRAPLTSGARLKAVLDEEKKLADEANSARTRERIAHALWAVVGIGAPLAALILGFVLWRRFGREPRPQFRGQYFRDIPEPALPPALVGYIWRMGDVTKEDASATLLDLIDRGVITIERVVKREEHLIGKDEQVTYRLTLVDEKREDLETFEERLVTLLFEELGDGGSLMLDELKDRAKAERQTFQTGYKEWVALVEERAEAMGFLDPTADRMAFWGAAAGFAAAVAAGAAAVFAQQPLYFVGIPVGDRRRAGRARDQAALAAGRRAARAVPRPGALHEGLRAAAGEAARRRGALGEVPGAGRRVRHRRRRHRRPGHQGARGHERPRVRHHGVHDRRRTTAADRRSRSWNRRSRRPSPPPHRPPDQEAAAGSRAAGAAGEAAEGSARADRPAAHDLQNLVLIAPLLFGVLLLVAGVLGAAGRLPKNDWVGLRLHVVMQDDETWRKGHKAAAPWLVAGGIIDTVGGLALWLERPPTAEASAVAGPLLVVAVVAYTIGVVARPGRADADPD